MLENWLSCGAKIIKVEKSTIFYATYFLPKSKIIVLFFDDICKMQYIN